MDSLFRHAAAQSFHDKEQTLVVRFHQAAFQLFLTYFFRFRQLQAMQTDFKRTNCFVQRFFKRTSNGHDFTGRFHLRTQPAVGGDKFIERPARNLCNDIVQRRLEAGVRLLGNRVFQLIQRIADGNLRRHLRDRIAGRFGRQRGGTAHARVYLNDIVLEAVRVERQLHVTSALDVKRADNFQRRGTQHLVFAVRNRLARRHYDTVACMDADRVDVFHVTHDNGVVNCVAHHFILNFFKTGNAFFDQALRNRTVLQTAGHNLAQFFLIGCNAAARTTQRVRGANDNRVADALGERQRFFHRMNDITRRHRFTDFLHEAAEQLTIFRFFDCF